MRNGQLPTLVADRTGQVWVFKAFVGRLVVLITHPVFVYDAEGYQPGILLDASHKESLAGTRVNLVEMPSYPWEESDRHERVT